MAELLAFSKSYSNVTTHVVFLHGLCGDKEKTWTSGETGPEFWPAWLEDDQTNIGIWSVGYDASPTKWYGTSMPLPDRAENVLARLLAEQRLAKGNIVFVGHSLGGLVIKQLLRCADRDALTNPTVESFLHRVRRVVFLGVPHQGAGLPVVARLLGFLAQWSSSTASLDRNDPHLRELNTWYRRYACENEIENLVLAETRAIRYLNFPLLDKLGFIVQPDSSDPGVDVVPIPVDADHFTIAKPSNREAEVYIHIRDFINKPFRTAHKNVLLANAITEAAEKQAQGFEEIKQTLSASDRRHAIERTDSKIIDTEAQQRLSIIRKSRFLIGFDLAENIRRLATSIKEGDLAGASSHVKVEVLGWCARFLSLPDKQLAQSLLTDAVNLGTCDEIVIARGFIKSNGGEISSALAEISSLNTPVAKSAAFIILKNQQGSQAALAWFKRAELSPSDLDPDGKFFLIQTYFQEESWNDAFSLAEQITEEDFACAPALIHMVAEAHLIQAIPNELRMRALQQIPFDVVHFPLASDDEALQHRRKAQALFERAAEDIASLGLTRPANLSSDIALWLALKDSEKSGSARIELENSMRDPATSLRRLSLALQFKMQVDLERVEHEIERQTALSGGKSLDAALARFSLAFVQETPSQVAAYIDRHRTQLNEHLDPKALGFVEIEMLADSGQIQKAELRFTELKVNGLTAIEEDRLRRIILEASGTDPIEQRLTLYNANKSITDLRNLVIALEERQDWSRLVEFARLLFDLTHDLSDASRYAKALYKTDELEKLLDFFKDFPAFLAQRKDLQQLHCWTLFQLGLFAEARVSLRSLKSINDNADCRRLTINIAIASGDWESLQTFVEEEWNARDIRSAEDILRAAKIAQMIRSSRSKELTFEASRKGAADPKVLIGCYGVASESGWEGSEEVAGWIQTAATLSDENGPIQLMSLKDIVDRQPGWEAHADQAWSMLTQGKAPMFAVARAVNRSLLSIFLVPALSNVDEPDVRKRVIIHAFSGARGYVSTNPKSLTMDATALLNAEFLGVLPAIFDHFDRIIIPHSTLGWLFEEKGKIPFHQPSRVSDAKELRRLIADGGLTPFEPAVPIPPELVGEVGEGLAAMLTDAIEKRPEDTRQRLAVHPYPVHRSGSLMQEEANLTGYESRLCGCLAVVEKLVERGELTATTAQNCKAYLSLHERPWPNEVAIEDSAVLYLDDVTVSHFQHLELLPKLRRAGFTAYVSKNKIDDSDALIEYESQAEKAASLVENLRLQLRKGLDSGRIKIGRQVRLQDNDPEEDEISLKAHPTMAILGLSAVADAVVIDDRALNQHGMITIGSEQRPLLTSLDLLNILKAHNVINGAQFSDFMTRLRRAGMSHVLLEQGELNRYLSMATIRNERLVETAELKSIRENVLRLRMSDSLQLPNEMTWLNILFETCFKCIREQWRDGADENIARATSDWIFDLMDARRWAHRFVGVNPDADARYRGQLVALMMLAGERENPMQQQYWKWFEDRILVQIKEENRPLFNWLVSHASEIVGNIVKEVPGIEYGN